MNRYDIASDFLESSVILLRYPRDTELSRRCLYFAVHF